MALAEEYNIIGIDPGTSVLGYGVINVKNKTISLVCAGVLKLDKIESHAERLKRILEKIFLLIEEHNPKEMAIEEPFFGKNAQSMLKLGRAQGVVMAAALSKNVPITEYSPKKVKMAVTGNGNASKEQVAAMVQHMLKFKEMPTYLDATDALGVAVCHQLQFKSGAAAKSKSYGSWGSFASQNPARIKKGGS